MSCPECGCPAPGHFDYCSELEKFRPVTLQEFEALKKRVESLERKIK